MIRLENCRFCACFFCGIFAGIAGKRSNIGGMNILELIIEGSLWSYLEKTEKPLYLYGMGDGAEKIIHYLGLYGKKVEGIFASDDFVRGQDFCGYTVCKYSDVVAKYAGADRDFIVLVAFGTLMEDVIENVKGIAQERELYAPNVPLFGEGLFDLDFVNANLSEIQKAYDYLADEQSKTNFVNLLNFALSGKIDYLFAAESSMKSAYELLDLGTDEVYVDLGAYNGDTVAEFVEVAGSYREICALEPDKKNYKKCLKNTEHLVNINCLNKGIWLEDTVLQFASKAGRNSSLNAKAGFKEVEVTSLDSLQESVLQSPATYVKMDVEGAEKQALLGGKNMIAAHKPKLLVSAYHRNEDMFYLINLIKDLNPKYKIYLKHHPYIPAWDTNIYAL